MEARMPKITITTSTSAMLTPARPSAQPPRPDGVFVSRMAPRGRGTPHRGAMREAWRDDGTGMTDGSCFPDVSGNIGARAGMGIGNDRFPKDYGPGTCRSPPP